jgi:hypothetical protein
VFQYFEDHHAAVCAHLGMVNNANCSSLPVEIREWFESLLFLVFTLIMLAHSQLESINPVVGGHDVQFLHCGDREQSF